MKKINLKIVILAASLVVYQTTLTQVWGESFFTFNYSPSLPTATLKDFIDKPSWISFRVDFMNDIKNQWSAGFGLGYTRFYDRLPRTVFQEGNNDISAVQTRQIELIPLLAKATYVNKSNPAVHFYAGVGMGIGFVSYDKLWGVYEDSNNKTSFRFCFEPVVGAFIRPGKNSRVRIHTGLSYMLVPYESSDINNISYLALNLGIRIPAR
jgi:hypothetical protein